ncbi:MAG: chromate reductase [Arcticibacterium sp.]|jgi:chromate reductase
MPEKIGIVVGTNRPGALSLEMAEYYRGKIESLGYETVLLYLKDLPDDFAFSALYHNRGRNDAYNLFQASIDSVQKLIFFAPEYNGSFPGVLKTFIDGLRYPDSLANKKVALVGLAKGVLGNAVGLSHLNDVLSYMGANVLGLRVKLGEIGKHFDGKKVSNLMYENFINQQIETFLKF